MPIVAPSTAARLRDSIAREANLREAARHLELVPEHRLEANRLYALADDVRRERTELATRCAIR